MPNPEMRKPRPTGDRVTAKIKNVNLILAEISGTVVAALIFCAVMWASVIGMANGFDTGIDGANLLAGLLTSTRRKFPPFAKRLRHGTGLTLWVCIGSHAWDRCKSATWMPGCKTLLPPGDDPTAYRWDFARTFDDVVLLEDGTGIGGAALKAIASELLPYTTQLIYLSDKGNPVKFTARSAHGS